MNDQWLDFLHRQGAETGADGMPVFPDAEAFPANALCDLSSIALLRASGADTQDFLQGQFTNDVRALDEDRHQMNSYCSPKGRMLVNFRLFMRDGDYLMMMPRAMLPAFHKRLQMFVLRAQVSIAEADDLVLLGMSGEYLHELLDVPVVSGETSRQGELSILRLPGEPRRVLVAAPVDAAEKLWLQARDKGAAIAGGDFWAWQDIRAGLPTVYPDTVESFVPQMANMQLVDGVSFTKGCYTGQEVVARMQYLGKLKRRMYLAHLDAEQCPAVGAELFSESSASGQWAGLLVDARPSPQGGFDALAVVEISSHEKDDLHLGDVSGPKVQFLDLPYPLDTEN